MLATSAFARAELDPGRTLQEAMMSAMEAQSPSMPAELRSEDISDHFAELAAALDNEYAELATTAAAFPPGATRAPWDVDPAALSLSFSLFRRADWSQSQCAWLVDRCASGSAVSVRVGDHRPYP
jgi:hypothetical protein